MAAARGRFFDGCADLAQGDIARERYRGWPHAVKEEGG